MKNADLHTHSTYSDGTLMPKELVKKAKEIGIKYLALTDHNSVEGIKEAINYGKKLRIEVIPGVEILSEWGEVLGYFIDINNKELLALLNRNKEELDRGARCCIKELNKLGIDISYKEVKTIFPKYPMMCFFVAQVLVKKKLLKSTEELYNKYIGKRFTIEYNLPKTEEVVSTIKNSKGVAILAHPFAEADYKKEFANIDLLIKAGLSGIEIQNGQHNSYDKTIKKQILNLAKKYNLILTSGSDFHGGLVKSELGDCMCDERIIINLQHRTTD